MNKPPPQTIIVDIHKGVSEWERWRCHCGMETFHRKKLHAPKDIVNKAVKHNQIHHRGTYTVHDQRYGNDKTELPSETVERNAINQTEAIEADRYKAERNHQRTNPQAKAITAASLRAMR